MGGYLRGCIFFCRPPKPCSSLNNGPTEMYEYLLERTRPHTSISGKISETTPEELHTKISCFTVFIYIIQFQFKRLMRFHPSLNLLETL